MKAALIKHGVYWVILICMVLTAFVAVLIRFCFPPVNIELLSLLAPKVTLLSVMIALATVQYNYFYTETRATNTTIEREEFGLYSAEELERIGLAKASLTFGQVHPRLGTLTIDELKPQVDKVDADVSAARKEWVAYRDKSLAEFAVRFGVLFSIILLIFSSVALDFLFQVWGVKALDPSFTSVVAFTMAIALGLFYITFMLIMVQTHIRDSKV